MTKQEIAHKLAEKTDLTTLQATHAVEVMIEIISDALVENNPISLRGFGTIKTVQRAAKIARNINTGEVVKVPSRRQVKFIAYGQLQSRIDHGHKESTL
jgi:nucleoid DNA-binding protein